MAVFLVSKGLRSSASASQVLSGTAHLLLMVHGATPSFAWWALLPINQYVHSVMTLNIEIVPSLTHTTCLSKSNGAPVVFNHGVPKIALYFSTFTMLK